MVKATEIVILQLQPKESPQSFEIKRKKKRYNFSPRNKNGREAGSHFNIVVLIIRAMKQSII